MDVLEAIRTRKSVRAWTGEPVEEEKLQAILEAGRLAPSAKNRQEWRYVVVRDAQTRKALIEVAKGQTFVGEAPVVIAVCAEKDDYRMTCGQPATPIDVAITVDHMTLAAVAEGLGTCWIGAFYADQAASLLGLPGNMEVVQLLPLGYPAAPGAVEKNRLSLDELVHYDKW